jgi:hypothetical protein
VLSLGGRSDGRRTEVIYLTAAMGSALSGSYLYGPMDGLLVEGYDWEEGIWSASDLWSSECLWLENIAQNNLGDHVVLDPKCLPSSFCR